MQFLEFKIRCRIIRVLKCSFRQKWFRSKCPKTSKDVVPSMSVVFVLHHSELGQIDDGLHCPRQPGSPSKSQSTFAETVRFRYFDSHFRSGILRGVTFQCEIHKKAPKTEGRQLTKKNAKHAVIHFTANRRRKKIKTMPHTPYLDTGF